MIAIDTLLGSVRLNKLTAKHGRFNRHGDPSQNPDLITALAQSRFMVVDRVESQWKGHITTNLILLIETATATFLVILKAVKTHFLLITAYPAHDRQIRRYTTA